MKRVKIFHCNHCGRNCRIRIELFGPSDGQEINKSFPHNFDPNQSCLFFKYGREEPSGSNFKLECEFEE